MNGNRETFKTFAAEYSREKRAPKFSVETPLLPIEETDVCGFEHDSSVAPHTDETFVVNTFSALSEVSEKLNSVERTKYAVTGTLWSVAALAAFALNSVVMVLDGGLLNIFFTTAGYLAYKQFKAAFTGTPHACLKFTCTSTHIKDRIGELFAYIKLFLKKLFANKNECTYC